MIFRQPSLALILTFGLAAGACENTAAGLREDARQAAESDAAAKAKDAANKTGAAVGAALETVDIKAALMADKSIDASSINVDTYAETKTVVLRGSVPTQAQREQAERIAVDKAKGYRVENKLAVVP
ncbi:MAG: BON domain-containing protein [Vicinamibacterales bacterium]